MIQIKVISGDTKKLELFTNQFLDEIKTVPNFKLIDIKYQGGNGHYYKSALIIYSFDEVEP